MAIARKIAYNVVVSSVCKVLSTVLALVVISLITRYLGKDGFGNYATVLAFLAFFAALTDLGLNQISTREIAKKGADEGKIIGNAFALRLAAALAVVLVVPVLVSFLPYPPEVKKGIMIVAVSFLFSSSYQILNGVFQKNLAMDKVAFGELIGKIIQVGFVFFAVKKSLGFDWIMLALLFNMAVTFSLVLFWSRKYLSFKMKFDLNYWKTFLKESMPLGIAAMISFAYFKMDTIILSYLKSSAEVGIYNAAYKVLENITFFPAMIVGLVLPIMAQNIFENKEKFKEIANKTYKVFIILTVPLVVGCLFLADGIIALIGGAAFAEAGNVLRILVFPLAFIFFGQLFNAILIVSNLQKKMMVLLGLAALLNISLNLLLIPHFSYLAAAYVSLATELLVVLGGGYLIRKNINFLPNGEKNGRIFLAGLAMAIFLFVLRELHFILAGLGGVAVYFAFLWIFKAVRTQELLSLISKKGVEEYEERT